MAIQDVGYKFIVQNVNGEDYYQVIPAANVPHGSREVTQQEFQQKEQQLKTQNPARWDPYFNQIRSSYKNAFTGGPSGYTYENGVFRTTSSIQAGQQEQQQIASGQLVQIGTSPSGQPLYAPSGSAATKNQLGIQQPQTQQQSLLKQGARGPEVTQLQQFLQSQGFSPGNIDSIFGPKTAAALKLFQKKAGISVDAIVGPQTRAAMQSKTQPTNIQSTQPSKTLRASDISKELQYNIDRFTNWYIPNEPNNPNTIAALAERTKAIAEINQMQQLLLAQQGVNFIEDSRIQNFIRKIGGLGASPTSGAQTSLQRAQIESGGSGQTTNTIEDIAKNPQVGSRFNINNQAGRQLGYKELQNVETTPEGLRILTFGRDIDTTGQNVIQGGEQKFITDAQGNFLDFSGRPTSTPTATDQGTIQSILRAYKENIQSGSLGTSPTGQTPQPVQPPTQPQTQFGPSTYTGPSIMDYLSSKGQNPSFSSRRQLAAQFLPGQSYTGSPEQNTELLNKLRSEGQQLGIQPGVQPGVSPTGGLPGAPGAPTTEGVGAITPQQGTQQYQNLLSMTANLQTGARGTEVQQLQQFLQSQGIDVGNIDGIFGPKTAAGLRQFQTQSGISPDAIVGPITRQKIQEKLGTGRIEQGGITPQPEPGQAPLSPAEQDYSTFLQQKSYDDIFTQLSDQVGLKDMKSRFEEFNTKLEEVRNRAAGNIADINNNPWISEELRGKKVANAQAASKQEEANAQEALNQIQKIYNEAQQEVQFRAKLIISQQQADKEFDFKAREAARREQERLQKLQSINTQVVKIGDRQVLINKQTGETIRDLGQVSTTGGVDTQELESLDTQIYNLMGQLSPEQLDQLIDLGLI